VNPLALFLKPKSPAERLAAQQRETAEGEAAQGAGRGRGKGRGLEEAHKAPAQLQELISFLLSQLF